VSGADASWPLLTEGLEVLPLARAQRCCRIGPLRELGEKRL